MTQTEQSEKSTSQAAKPDAARILGRIYFIATVPFIGGAVAPWIMGPTAHAEIPSLLLWSLAVLIFSSAAWCGYCIGSKARFALGHGFVSLCITGGAIIGFLLGDIHNPFWTAGIFTFLHWVHLLWLQKTIEQPLDILKLHQRFVWTLLATHMMVLFNMVQATKNVF